MNEDWLKTENALLTLVLKTDLLYIYVKKMLAVDTQFSTVSAEVRCCILPWRILITLFTLLLLNCVAGERADDASPLLHLRSSQRWLRAWILSPPFQQYLIGTNFSSYTGWLLISATWYVKRNSWKLTIKSLDVKIWCPFCFIVDNQILLLLDILFRVHCKVNELLVGVWYSGRVSIYIYFNIILRVIIPLWRD